MRVAGCELRVAEFPVTGTSSPVTGYWALNPGNRYLATDGHRYIVYMELVFQIFRPGDLR
jgi:hypothetical protein